jgi:hypothetical protein
MTGSEGMEKIMTKFAISTDSTTTVIEASSRDEAARQFAATERIYAGCETAAQLAEKADDLGGWAEVNELP